MACRVMVDTAGEILVTAAIDDMARRDTGTDADPTTEGVTTNG